MFVYLVSQLLLQNVLGGLYCVLQLVFRRETGGIKGTGEKRKWCLREEETHQKQEFSSFISLVFTPKCGQFRRERNGLIFF